MGGADDYCVVQQGGGDPQESFVDQEDRGGSSRDLTGVPRWVSERVGLCVYAQGQDAFEDLFGEGKEGSHREGGEGEG